MAKGRKKTKETDAHQIAAIVRSVTTRLDTAEKDFLEIGREMLAAKALLKRGEFLPWLESMFPTVSYRTRRNYMASYEFVEAHPEARKLDRTVIFELVTKSIPDEVVEEVLDKAKAGISMTATEVRKLLKEHRNPTWNRKAIARKQAADAALALLRKQLKPAAWDEFMDLATKADRTLMMVLKEMRQAQG